MTTAITFRAAETTGGVADKSGKVSRNETTGGVGYLAKQDSIFTVDNEPENDTVSFRGNSANKKEVSTGNLVLGLAALTALLIGGMGLAHKYDLAGKIKNQKVQDFFRHTDSVTKPCHDACTWIKHNSYDKIVKFFSKK